MKVELMRSEIIKPYDSKKWHDRVACMSDEQVIAIYYRFLHAGKFQVKSRTSPKYTVKPTEYRCSACGATYERDNPDLTKCEICGATLGEMIPEATRKKLYQMVS